MRKLFFFLSPFLLFFLTYVVLIYYYHSEKITVPSLVGKNFSDIVNLSNHFNFKVCKVTCNKEYPHHSIISQYPKAGSLLKSNYSINIEVNFNETMKQFNFKNKNCQDVLSFLKQEGINYKIINIYLPNKKNNIIIASKYDFKSHVLYLYKNTINEKKNIIIRNLIGIDCNSIKNSNIDKLIISCYDSYNNYVKECPLHTPINMQRPLPGRYKKEENNFNFQIWHYNCATQHKNV
jgi:hypothetical protein